MSLVLDSSITLAWVHIEETTQVIRDISSQVLQNGAWVPSLWRLEVANVLEMGIRRGRHNSAFRDTTLADLALLPINIDPDTEKYAWNTTLRLAVRHHLTLYDAAYLELAQRRGSPLATLDKELRAAARKEKIVILGE